jgi:hypothetical protein
MPGGGGAVTMSPGRKYRRRTEVAIDLTSRRVREIEAMLCA